MNEDPREEAIAGLEQDEEIEGDLGDARVEQISLSGKIDGDK
jgi:hypothetical protein